MIYSHYAFLLLFFFLFRDELWPGYVGLDLFYPSHLYYTSLTEHLPHLLPTNTGHAACKVLASSLPFLSRLNHNTAVPLCNRCEHRLQKVKSVVSTVCGNEDASTDSLWLKCCANVREHRGPTNVHITHLQQHLIVNDLIKYTK